MKTKNLIEEEKKSIMQSYTRFPIAIAKGKGSYVYDLEGKKYLDCIGGLATCTVGHANQNVTKAIQQQAKTLINVTNLYYTQPQLDLAKKLQKYSNLQKCFFCNSGTEANETAIKLAKKISKKSQIISFEHGFHGRTLGSLAATWKTKFKKQFEPLVPGFIFVPYNNIKALQNAISKQTAAVMIEPIQGEGGINVPDKGYLKK